VTEKFDKPLRQHVQAYRSTVEVSLSACKSHVYC